jgi:competence protein ComEC
MREWILAFSLGVFVGSFIPSLPTMGVSCLFLIPFLLSLRFKIILLAGAFCLGLWWLLLQATVHDRNILPDFLEQEELWVTGIVKGLPQINTSSTRFRFSTASLCQEFHRCSAHLLSSERQSLLLNDYSGLDIQPGQQWQLKVRLKQPHGFANPGGFDYEGWLFSENIAATGYIRADNQNRLLEYERGRSKEGVFDKARYAFREKLANKMLQSPGFLAALTIGDRYWITDEEWLLLSKTGTNHLMVISGLHISLVAWLAYKLSFLLFRCSPNVCLVMPAPRIAAIVAILTALAYGALAGFSLPVQRALVMVLCLMGGPLLLRQTNPFNSLCLALFLVLLLDPLAPSFAGFWLSFLAVCMLLLSLFRQDQTNLSALEKLKGMVRSQAFLFIGLMPVMLLFFQQVSLIAPLVNLVAIPFVGLIVVPLCLLALLASLASPALFNFLITLPDFLLSVFVLALQLLATHLDFLLLKFPMIPSWLLVVFFLVVLLNLFQPNWIGKLAFLPLIFLGFNCRINKPETGDIFVDILDVGQGLSVVVQTHEHLLVYDTGPAYSVRFNAGSGIIVPFLSSQNLGSPDMIVVSHGDNDHAGGLDALVDSFPNSQIISGETLPVYTEIKPCLAGQNWVWDDVRFEFLYPPDSQLQNRVKGNNASCVLKISTGNVSVLLPGDIEIETEFELLRSNGGALAATVLLAPHHGSKTSSITPLVRRVQPEYVVFSTGYLNRFNHPHPDVVARYQYFGTKILATPDTGNIRFHLTSNNGVEGPYLYRESHPRFWYR